MIFDFMNIDSFDSFFTGLLFLGIGLTIIASVSIAVAECCVPHIKQEPYVLER